MEKQKRKYVKPMIAYCDFLTGQIRGNTEMIEELERNIELSPPSYQSPAPDFCCYRGYETGSPAERETEGQTYG